MKGTVTLKILEDVAETTRSVGDLIGTLLEAGYGASISKLQYVQSKREQRRARGQRITTEENKGKQRYYSLLYQLKKDGLLIEAVSSRGNFLRMTRKGESRLSALRTRLKESLPEPSYSREESGRVTIVVFDVPEKDRKKRDWLRAVLKRIGLVMIQR